MVLFIVYHEGWWDGLIHCVPRGVVGWISSLCNTRGGGMD